MKVAFYRVFIILLFSLITTTSLYAGSDINDKFNELLKSLNSTITVNGSDIKTGISKLSNGMQFDIFRLKGEIRHPITDKPMGKQRVKVGDAKVSNGRLIFNAKEPLQTGDKINVKLPFIIETDFKSLDKNQIHEITFELNKIRGVELGKSDYRFRCYKVSDKDKNLDISIDCALKNGDDKIMQASFSYRDITMTPILYQDIKNNKDNRIKFNREINSIAVGHIYGKEKGAYLLASDKSRVLIYKVNSDMSITSVGSINGDFTSIISVDIADVNNNGIDEIFISNLIDKNSVASSIIYEFDGEKLVLVKSDLECLFRSYYSGGKRSILMQNYIHKEFVGLIGVYGYVDDDYKIVSDIVGSLGHRVYGSGISENGDYSFINKAGNFSIRYKDNSMPISKQLFGDTNKHIFYSKENVVGSRANPSGGEMPITETLTVAYPVYQRIIEVDRNKFFLSENTPIGVSVEQIDNFKSAFFGVYLISLSDDVNMLDVYEYQQPIDAETSIIEADIINIDSKDYIFMLSNKSRERYSSSSNSLLSVISLYR